MWTAILGLGVGILVYLTLQFSRMVGGSGSNQFFVFSGYTLFISLLAGLFLTADSVAQERREGTLGLLFLSGLGPWDVLSGKLVATSMAAAYAVMGLIPLMAIPVLAGGVTLGEVVRVSLALGNGLWVAVTLGLLFSVLIQDPGRSTVLAMGAMLATSLGALFWWPAVPVLSELFPVTAFAAAKAGSARFWQSLATSHLVGWTLFLLAGFALRASWQTGEPNLIRLWPGNHLRRLSRRNQASTPDADPISRLAHPGRWGVLAPWLLILLGAVPVVAISTLNQSMLVGRMGLWPIAFILKLLIAQQASRWIVESRRNGNLELVLGTPLSDREILSAHMALIRRLFAGPLTAYVLVNILLGTGLFYSTGSAMNFLMITQIFSMGAFLVDCVAAAWVGTWLALTMSKPQFAFGVTLLILLILPTLFCGFGLILSLILLAVAGSRLSTGVRSLAWKPRPV